MNHEKASLIELFSIMRTQICYLTIINRNRVQFEGYQKLKKYTNLSVDDTKLGPLGVAIVNTYEVILYNIIIKII
jgi:hypothetical protein